MTPFFRLFALFGLIALGACQTIEGAGQDIESAGEAVQDESNEVQYGT